MSEGKGEMWRLLLLWLLALPTLAEAQQAPRPLLLEGGISGGYSNACPGQYVCVEGRVVGPLSAYGMVEAYRCPDLAGTANRLGASLRLGRADWLVRPAVRGGLEYDGGEFSRNLGASLTFGRRYGARFIVNRGVVASGAVIVLLQLGGYVSF